MDWIYLSPHLDDAALSLGGLIWEQTQAGQRVSIWTICAGDPPSGDFSPFAESLHARWGIGWEAIQVRRAEDIQSCRRLGAAYHHFDVPDCIYRRSPKTGNPLYASEEALWVPVHADEKVLIDKIKKDLLTTLPKGAKLVCPLTIGDHVDHRLTRAAAEKLGIPLDYYAEYPYVCDDDVPQLTANYQSTVSYVSPAGLLAWQDAIEAHRSQISTFWASLEEMRLGIQEYYQKMGGVHLWSKNRT
jgi:LmbE family N-acetylglucosaminyl deacetylase